MKNAMLKKLQSKSNNFKDS